jgi:hypothetical protein
MGPNKKNIFGPLENPAFYLLIRPPKAVFYQALSDGQKTPSFNLKKTRRVVWQLACWK